MLPEKNKFDEFVELGKKLSGTLQFTEKRKKYFRRTADNPSSEFFLLGRIQIIHFHSQ